MNPAEALRLSRAKTLTEKHGVEGDGMRPGPDDYVFTIEQIADLVDEATAAKNATIAELRQAIADDQNRREQEAYLLMESDPPEI